MDNWIETLDRLNVVVVIPTYNNHKTIGQVIADVRQYANNVIVVNDGSTDGTAEILDGIGGIEVITHPQNCGKGTAHKNGLCRAKTAGFRYAITIDSDGQHFAKDIPSFVQEIEQNPDTLLVGSRNIQADNMPGKNTFANKFSNFWFRLQTGINLPDTQTGYRLYPLHQLPNLGLLTSRYEAELELLVGSAWRGTHLVPIAVNVFYPKAEERVTHFRPFWDFLRITLLNTGLCFGALFYGLPSRLIHKLKDGHE